MLFICSHKTCPEHVEPCIFSMDDMDHAIGRTTVCPVGKMRAPWRLMNL